MAIVLDAMARKAVSRRIVKLSKEIDILEETVDNLDETSNAYLEVDHSNNIFLEEWLAISDSYLEEKSIIVAEEYLTFTVLEVDNSPTTAGDTNKFFPYSSSIGLTNNFYLIPQINVYTAGIANSNLSDGEYKRAKSFQQICNLLLTGLTGGADTTLAGVFTATDTTVNVADASGIAEDSKVIITGTDGAVTNSSYLFYVRTKTGNTLNGWTICGGTSTIVAGQAVVVGGGVIWNDLARNNLAISLLYVPLPASIVAYSANTWSAFLNDEVTALAGNIDSRAIQLAENEDARLIDIPQILSDITTWLAFPTADGGGNSRFNDGALTIFRTAVNNRITKITDRITEIATAQGSITDNGDGSYNTTAGALAYRYQWLDRRLNKSHGSLAQETGADTTKNIVEQQYNDSIDALANYQSVMTATAIKSPLDDIFSDMEGFEIEESEEYNPRQLEVEDTTGFSINDFVYVIDEENAELSGYIKAIYPDTNLIFIDFDVSTDYNADNLARLYKVL